MHELICCFYHTTLHFVGRITIRNNKHNTVGSNVLTVHPLTQNILSYPHCSHVCVCL